MDYYNALGADRFADPDEIKKRYRALARQYHPDANNGDPVAAERFKEISEAYATLGDPKRRDLYNNGIVTTASRPAGAFYVEPGDMAGDFTGFTGGFPTGMSFGDLLDDLLDDLLGTPSERPRGAQRQTSEQEDPELAAFKQGQVRQFQEFDAPLKARWTAIEQEFINGSKAAEGSFNAVSRGAGLVFSAAESAATSEFARISARARAGFDKASKQSDHLSSRERAEAITEARREREEIISAARRKKFDVIGQARLAKSDAVGTARTAKLDMISQLRALKNSRLTVIRDQRSEYRRRQERELKQFQDGREPTSEAPPATDADSGKKSWRRRFRRQ